MEQRWQESSGSAGKGLVVRKKRVWKESWDCSDFKGTGLVIEECAKENVGKEINVVSDRFAGRKWCVCICVLVLI